MHGNPLYHSYFQWLHGWVRNGSGKVVFANTFGNVSGLPGHPEDYDYATQKAAAAKIPVSSWTTQFPGCAKKLGIVG